MQDSQFIRRINDLRIQSSVALKKLEERSAQTAYTSQVWNEVLTDPEGSDYGSLGSMGESNPSGWDVSGYPPS